MCLKAENLDRMPLNWKKLVTSHKVIDGQDCVILNLRHLLGAYHVPDIGLDIGNWKEKNE